MLSTWITTDETHLAPWDVCQVFCCDVVEGLSVFPSIIHSIICSIIVNHMIHGYLVYTLNCNPRLLKLFHPGSLRALFFGPCIPLTCPIILAFVFFFFLALSYFLALQDASISSCVFPAPFLESAIFSRELWVLSVVLATRIWVWDVLVATEEITAKSVQ